MSPKPIVVTCGQAFTDIDALACAIAYAELLKLEGKEAEVVLPGVLNFSVTEKIKSWGFEFKTTPSFSDFEAVLVDVSNQESFAKCIGENKIIEIYDHHYGWQDHWNEVLGSNSHIELIGACATLIWEEFKKRGFGDKISPVSANLLYTAIISNTLNFGAQVTDSRDIEVFNALKSFIDLPEDWTAIYFKDQEKSVSENVRESITSDTKVMNIPGIAFPLVIGQMELWEGKSFLFNNIGIIKETLSQFKHDHWIMSAPSISENKNYLYTENAEMKELFSKIIDARFVDNIGTTDKLWLRKEIRKKLYEYSI